MSIHKFTIERVLFFLIENNGYLYDWKLWKLKGKLLTSMGRF